MSAILSLMALIFIVFPYVCYKNYKEGKVEYEQKCLDKYYNERQSIFKEFLHKVQIAENSLEEDTLMRQVWDHKEEILQTPIEIRSPALNNSIAFVIYAANRGKLTFQMTFTQIGHHIHKHHFEKNKYDSARGTMDTKQFVELIFWVDKKLKEHGINERLFLVNHGKEGDSYYVVTPKNKMTIIQRQYKQTPSFCWEAQANPIALMRGVEDYPYNIY